MKTIALAILMLSACSNDTAKEHTGYGKKLVYFKDHQTSLCFAYGFVDQDHGGPMLTNVPCINVENVLVNPPEEKRQRDSIN